MVVMRAAKTRWQIREIYSRYESVAGICYVTDFFAARLGYGKVVLSKFIGAEPGCKVCAYT